MVSLLHHHHPRHEKNLIFFVIISAVLICYENFRIGTISRTNSQFDAKYCHVMTVVIVCFELENAVLYVSSLERLRIILVSFSLSCCCCVVKVCSS